MMRGQLLFRPGTVLLVIFIALFGYFVFSWASGSISGTGQQALQSQEEALDCSRLDVDFLGLTDDSNSTTVSFQVNMDVDDVKVSFQGKENRTVEIESLRQQELASAKARGNSYSDILVVVDGCGKVFRYQ